MTISSVAPPSVPSTVGVPEAPATPAGWQGLFAGLLGGSTSSGDGASATLPDTAGQDASGQDASGGDTAPGVLDILSAAQVMAAAQVVPVTPVLAAALNLSAGGGAVAPGALSTAVAAPVAAPAGPATAGAPSAGAAPSLAPLATPSTGSAAVSAGAPVPPPVASSAVPLAAPATTEVIPSPVPPAADARVPAPAVADDAAPVVAPLAADPSTPATGAPVPGPTGRTSADVAASSTAPDAAPITAGPDASPATASEGPAAPAGAPVQSTGQDAGQPGGQDAGHQTPQDQGQQLAAPQHPSVHHHSSSSDTAAPAPAPSVTGAPAAMAPSQVATPVGRHHADAHAHVTGQVFPEVAQLVSRGDGTRRITLKLSPEALGDVRVTLTVRHGDVHVRMIGSEQAQQALRAGTGELQRLLEGTGASSGQIVVGDHSAADTGWQNGPGTGHHSEDNRPAGTRDGDTSARDGSRGGPQQRASIDPSAASGAITRTHPGVDVTM